MPLGRGASNGDDTVGEFGRGFDCFRGTDVKDHLRQLVNTDAALRQLIFMVFSCPGTDGDKARLDTLIPRECQFRRSARLPAPEYDPLFR